MKKLFYAMAIFAAMAFTTACDKNEEPELPTEPVFSLQVYMNDKLMLEQNDIEWALRTEEDGTCTLYMDKTRFVEMMPYLDLRVPGLQNQSSESGVFSFSAQAITPLYAGQPYPQYELSQFVCEQNAADGTLSVTFYCIGFKVVYFHKK